MMKSISLSRDFQAQLTKHMNTKPCSSNSSSPTLDSPDLANAALSDFFGFPPEMMSNFSKMMPGMMGGSPGMPNKGMPPFSMPGMMPHSMDGSPMSHSAHMNTPPIDLSNGPKPNSQQMLDPTQTNTDQVTHVDLSKWREKQFEVMSKYMHTKDNSSTASEGSLHGGSVRMAACRSSDATSLDGSPAGASSQASPMNIMSAGPTDVSQLDPDTDITIISDYQKQRIGRFMSYISVEMQPDMLELIMEVQKGIVESHLTHCYHQRPRIYAVSAELDAREQVCVGLS